MCFFFNLGIFRFLVCQSFDFIIDVGDDVGDDVDDDDDDDDVDDDDDDDD